MEENIKFSEETSKDEKGQIIKKYYINGKEVNSNTYFTLTDDFYSDINMINKKQNYKIGKDNINDTSNTIDIKNNSNENINDEDDVLYEVVSNIKEMDDDSAVGYLQDIIDKNNEVISYETQVAVYNELGKNMFKASAKLDNELDDMVNNYENGNDQE